MKSSMRLKRGNNGNKYTNVASSEDDNSGGSESESNDNSEDLILSSQDEFMEEEFLSSSNEVQRQRLEETMAVPPSEMDGGKIYTIDDDDDVELAMSPNGDAGDATARSMIHFEIGEADEKEQMELNKTPPSIATTAAMSEYECDDVNGEEMDSFLKSSSWLPSKAHDWLFPSDVPRSVQLFRKENIAIPACYLCVGVVSGFIGPFINVYPLDLGATEAQQATISSLVGLPSTLKIFFGFLSDNLPIFGYRRKSYMLLGWLISALSLTALMIFTDLGLDKRVELGEDGVTEVTVRIPPDDAPSVPFLSLLVFVGSMGLWIADVMGDSLVAEKAKLEPESTRGHLQSSCYLCRFTGTMFSAPLSMILYSAYGPNPIIFMSIIFPLLIIPLIYNFWEPRNIEIKSTHDQCHEIWTAVCSRAVWQPMGVVYIYGTLQVSNAAWREYLKSVLNFTATQLNALLLVGGLLAYLGIVTYKYCLITWPWRKIYFSTTLLNGFFSALQLLLIQGITFGLSPFLFALGDDALDDFILGMQFLLTMSQFILLHFKNIAPHRQYLQPVCIMMVHLCPNGSEGAAYAMFTTVCNSADTLSTAISTMLLGVWDVSKETLIAGDLSGMKKLTILTTALQISGIVFINLLPNRKEDLDSLKNATASSNSRIGGFIFLSITFLSVVYSVFVGVMNTLHPGWSGES